MSIDETAAAVEYPACPGCGNGDIPRPLVYEASVFSEGHTVGLSRCPETLASALRKIRYPNWISVEMRHDPQKKTGPEIGASSRPLSELCTKAEFSRVGRRQQGMSQTS